MTIYISNTNVRANLSSFPQSKLPLLLSLALWVVLTFTQSSRSKNFNILTPLSSLPICPLYYISRSNEFHFLNISQVRPPPSASISTSPCLGWNPRIHSNVIYYNSSSTTTPNFNFLKVDLFCLRLFVLFYFYFLFSQSNNNYLFLC